MIKIKFRIAEFNGITITIKGRGKSEAERWKSGQETKRMKRVAQFRNINKKNFRREFKNKQKMHICSKEMSVR